MSRGRFSPRRRPVPLGGHGYRPPIAYNPSHHVSNTQSHESKRVDHRTGPPTAWGPGTNAQTPVPSDVRDTAGGEGSCWWNGRRVRRRLDESLPTHATGAAHALPREPPAVHNPDPRMEAWPRIRGILKENATLFTPAARTVVFFTVSLALIWKSIVFSFGGRNFGNQFGIRRWPHFVAHHALAFRESFEGALAREMNTPEIARSARAP